MPDPCLDGDAEFDRAQFDVASSSSCYCVSASVPCQASATRVQISSEALADSADAVVEAAVSLATTILTVGTALDCAAGQLNSVLRMCTSLAQSECSHSTVKVYCGDLHEEDICGQVAAYHEASCILGITSAL